VVIRGTLERSPPLRDASLGRRCRFRQSRFRPPRRAPGSRL